MIPSALGGSVLGWGKRFSKKMLSHCPVGKIQTEAIRTQEMETKRKLEWGYPKK
jgi:hypothetical protein